MGNKQTTEPERPRCYFRLPNGELCGEPAPHKISNQIPYIAAWRCEAHRPAQKSEVQEALAIEIMDHRGNVLGCISAERAADGRFGQPLRFRLLYR